MDGSISLILSIGVILVTSSILSLVLQRLRQPRVIAEVLGGILLGPTALGRIPWFTETIFPSEIRPYLTFIANIGLCLFIFLVGIEIDANLVRRNAKQSAVVAISGIVIPFALGATLSIPLYDTFIRVNAPFGDPVSGNIGAKPVNFVYFMLFTGVAFSITAFPVLCRILKELKLLNTTVGVVVLSAGVANDVVGWVLLALSVALVNASSSLMALWICSTCAAWIIFMLFPIRWAVCIIARRMNAVENGPNFLFVTLIIIIVFVSASITDRIGVHAIFGAFLAGLVVPREGHIPDSFIRLFDIPVTTILLPLYFTLSGLSTDLGLLNNGTTWVFAIAIISLAFLGKFGACTVAARYFASFTLREASAIGALMSCKGLVELIVLNVGLNAGILTKRVFSMFVLEALFLTFMTTPLVNFLYPPRLRVGILNKGYGTISPSPRGGHT